MSLNAEDAMTTLTLTPASRVRKPLSPVPATNLPNELVSRPPRSGQSVLDRPGFAPRFLLSLLRSLAVTAA
jgi:hypothetical protein